jgi:ABC-type uncharacterized transport system permease subunit
MRFLRLYKTFVVQQLKRLMEYRVDFLTGAASFLVVKLIHAHVLLFNLHGSIVEWGSGVRTCRHGD